MVAAAEQLIGPLKIEALANGGAGIGRDHGRVIFVPRTVPGDLVRCRLVKEKKRYAEAELVEVLQPAQERCQPPCPVADQCGGCQWQQLPYLEQLRWKERLFHETLQRQCQVDSSALLPIVPSPETWGYRSRVQIKCFKASERFVCGFFRPKSRYVVDVESCPVMAPELNELLATLRGAIAPSRFADRIPQIDLALGDDGRRRAVIHYLGSDGKGLSALLMSMVQSEDVALLLQTGRKDSLLSVAGDPQLTISVDSPEILLKYHAGGFAQINLEQNRRLVSAVLRAADLSGGERVMDLYCGMGNFTLPLARRAAAVCGVEDYAPSIAAARHNATANQLANVEFHASPAEGALERFGTAAPFDLLLIDPPRSGAFGVAKELVRRPVKKILYVSCDPQTLARDLTLLVNNGYRLVSSQPFDMFPHTYHVESLSLLEFVGSC